MAVCRTLTASGLLLMLCWALPPPAAEAARNAELAASSADHGQHRQSSWGGLARLLELGKRKRATECEDPAFRKQLLPYIKEMPFIGLFKDILGETKFEASGMTIASGGPGGQGHSWLWVVFDNLHALGRVNEQFEFRDPRNKLVGPLGDDSQFEGLTFSEATEHFFAVEEVFDDEDHGFHPFVHEIQVDADGSSYTTIARCPVHFVLTHENKGFEGLHLHEAEGHTLLLGLCEGNYCVGGSQGREPGNGRVVVAEFNGRAGDECGWDVVKTVDIPPSAFFTDYSGMAFRGNKVAIISQENSTLWLGTFDFEALEFTSEGTVYYFPRDHHCDHMYCNVEGIQWIDDVRFVIASDKAKRTQSFKCVAHEQRLSIFSLPDTSGHLPDATD